MVKQYQDVPVEDRARWRAWLAAHSEAAGGCWAVTWRKGSGRPSVPYADLVEEGLCVGWIDSRGRRVDEARTALLFTPRRTGSGWSGPNKERIGRLEPAGLLLPSGQAVVDAARADGSWVLLDSVEALEEPVDLAAALDADPAARVGWNAFPRSVRRSLLERLVLAKRPETRARRIADAVEVAARGVRPQ